MIQVQGFGRGWRIAAILTCGLALAACARGGAEIGGPGGAGLTAGGGAPGSAQDFVVNVGDRVFFETDSPELTPIAIATLNRQAEWLTRYSRVVVMIEGHADERGTREYNIALGARRAATTKNYLISRGVGANRMNTISYGKERPVAVCNDISCWSQNRRAVTVIQNAGS